MGVYKGKPAIMDHKTTKKMKTRDMIEDYFCQLAAYRLAHNEVYGTSIDSAVIFMVSRDLKYEGYELDKKELDHWSDVFLQRVDTFLNKPAETE